MIILHRFRDIISAGAGVPFYNTARKHNSKKGTSFGFGKKIGGGRKSESPGPAGYENFNTSFRSNSKPSKNGKFGVTHDKYYLVRSLIWLTYKI
jgi:hypothetical protein